MRRIFIDTNIILDLLGNREPFYLAAAQLATLADKKQIILVASSLSFANANYVLSKFESPQIAIEKLRRFRIICEIGDLNEEVLDKGLASSFKDFEDALQYHSALQSNCEIIISRNTKDFKKPAIPIMTAEEFLKSL
jgi:predicted nucleic acid-binding protein